MKKKVAAVPIMKTAYCTPDETSPTLPLKFAIWKMYTT
jgi:hypothetical protein